MKSQSLIMILTVIFTLITTIIAIVVSISRRKKMQTGTGAEKGILPSGGQYEYEGITYNQVYFAGGKNAPPYFQLSLACSCNGSFRVKKETGFERFFKRVGITREIKTHDQDFDGRYFIDTKQIDFGEMFFRKPKNRGFIRDIFQNRFTEIHCNGREIYARMTPFKKKEGIQPEEIQRVVMALNNLVEDLKTYQDYPLQTTKPWKLKAGVAVGIPVVLHLVGIMGLIFGLTQYPPLDTFKVMLDSLKYSLPVFGIYLWLAIALVKGQSSSHRVVMFILIFSLVSFPLAGAGIEIYLNGRLDISPSMAHHQSIVGKYYRTSRSGKSYYLKVESWRKNRETEIIKVSYSRYSAVVPNQTPILVTTKSGRFDFEWRVDYRIGQ